MSAMFGARVFLCLHLIAFCSALSCPPDKPLEFCFVDPCVENFCSAPNSICEANKCGGCFAVWKDKDTGQQLSKQDCKPRPTTPTTTTTTTSTTTPTTTTPTTTTTTTTSTTTTTTTTPTTTTTTTTTTTPTTTTTTAPPTTTSTTTLATTPLVPFTSTSMVPTPGPVNGCPPDLPITPCDEDPCQRSTCHAPNSRCVINHCGGCFAEWVNTETQKKLNGSECQAQMTSLVGTPLPSSVPLAQSGASSTLQPVTSSPTAAAIIQVDGTKSISAVSSTLAAILKTSVSPQSSSSSLQNPSSTLVPPPSLEKPEGGSSSIGRNELSALSEGLKLYNQFNWGSVQKRRALFNRRNIS